MRHRANFLHNLCTSDFLFPLQPPPPPHPDKPPGRPTPESFCFGSVSGPLGGVGGGASVREVNFTQSLHVFGCHRRPLAQIFWDLSGLHRTQILRNFLRHMARSQYLPLHGQDHLAESVLKLYDAYVVLEWRSTVCSVVVVVSRLFSDVLGVSGPDGQRNFVGDQRASQNRP